MTSRFRIRDNWWTDLDVNFRTQILRRRNLRLPDSGEWNFRTASFGSYTAAREWIAARHPRRRSRTKIRCRRKLNHWTLRQNGRGERGSRERKMERLGLFWFHSLQLLLRFQFFSLLSLQFFLLAILASDFAERSCRSL